MPNQQKIKEFLASDRAILMLCIGIAFIFWLVIKLSYTYKSSLIVDVTYNIPQDKVFTIPPAQVLELDIEGTGWNLLSLVFSSKSPTLHIDAQKDEISEINASSLKGRIMDFVKNVQIKHITPENINLKTENSASKTVPITLDYQIGLAPLHQLSDSLQISPKIVEIKGPASIIKEINHWHTTPLILQNIKKTIHTNLALQATSNNSIQLSVQTIDCLVPVEEVTEKQIEVPIEVLNAPDSLLLVVLPKKIKVSCSVGLSDYERLKPDAFRAVINFEQVNLNAQAKVKVLLRERPAYVKNILYSPQKVDFIIRKNR